MKIQKSPDKIRKKHILNAAKKYKEDGNPSGFKNSTTYDVIIKGKPYPPKIICSLAYQEATGQPLESNEFAGAIEGKWLKTLKDLGFEIVDKRSLEAQERDFQKEVSAKLKKIKSGRLEIQTASAPPTPPEKIKTEIYRFNRSTSVVAQCLYEAKGICKKCGKDAPFKRKRDGEPYLQVHHIVPLSKGGLDIVENTMAVCPNCHCEIHDEMGVELFSED